MARKPDWLNLAHQIHLERLAIQSKLPPPIECDLTLNAYSWGGGADFSVTLTHRTSQLSGHGTARTPDEALAKAWQSFEEAARERAKRPALVVGSARTLSAKEPTDG